MTVHFVHIGKTGGSAIKYALRSSGWGCRAHEYATKGRALPETRYGHAIVHAHEFKLRDLEPEEYAFFSVRDPISRFVSGFYSRQRKGQPRLYVEWNDAERATFERFSTPQELALALVSDDPSTRKAARRAFHGVKHIRHLSLFLGTEAELREKLSRVVYIARLETLTQEWDQLKTVLGLPPELQLPTDPVASHRGDVPTAPLDEHAIAALRDWYAEDYRILDACDTIRAEHNWGVVGATPHIVVPSDPVDDQRALEDGTLPSGEVKRLARRATDAFDFWTRFLRRTQVRVAAEVGVGRGEFAKHILDTCRALETYYMIDPWRRLDDRNSPANTGDDFAAVFDEAMAATQAHEEKRIVLRGLTTEVADEIPDGSLDFVYVDGDHTLRGILVDLVRIYPKVREGGWIGGADFSQSMWHRGPRVEPSFVFPVAVHFAEAVGARIYGLPHSQFLLRKRSDGSFEFRVLTRRYPGTDMLSQVKPNRTRPTNRARAGLRRRLKKGRP